jgi:hypothetical protein
VNRTGADGPDQETVMSMIRIDRLTLRCPCECPAERLARLIGERLIVSDLPRAGSPLGTVHLHLQDSGAGADEMAQRIVDGLLQELTRSL